MVTDIQTIRWHYLRSVTFALDLVHGAEAAVADALHEGEVIELARRRRLRRLLRLALRHGRLAARGSWVFDL